MVWGSSVEDEDLRGAVRVGLDVRLGYEELTVMKTTIYVLAMAAVSSFPVMAQEARMGVSHPDETAITASPEGTVAPVKPSAAIHATTSNTAGSGAAGTTGAVYGAYVPYTGPRLDRDVVVNPKPLTEAQADADVVTTVVDRPGELREGTLLRARLVDKLSTISTEPGARFKAVLAEAVVKDGRVVMPVGSTVEGRVTTVHSGRRISGAAMIHLEADTILLPDGTRYSAHLQLIDTDQTRHTKVDGEGSMIRRDHPRETLAAVGLATGGGAAAGAVIGGGVGAAVGAGIGAGAGTILWLKTDRQEVVPEQAMLVFSLSSAMPLVPQSATISESRAPRVAGNPDAMVVGDQ